VRQIQAVGVTTFRAIAAALNDRGVRTARGLTERMQQMAKRNGG
jgi:hypothetical protein